MGDIAYAGNNCAEMIKLFGNINMIVKQIFNMKSSVMMVTRKCCGLLEIVFLTVPWL